MLAHNRRSLKPGSHIPWPMRLLTWLASCLVMAGLLGAGLFWFLRDHPAFHVAAVRVYGAERVPQPDLIALAQIPRATSLFRISVEGIRTRLMQHPWIRDALVRRIYPHALEIIVYERRPSAVLESGKEYLIDGEGHLLGQPSSAEAASLPRLVARLSHTPSLGERLTDPAVKAGLHLLDQVRDNPFFRNTVITQIDIMNAERFVVNTGRGTFIMGASLVGIDDKLELFPAIDEALRSSARRAEYVDLSIAHQVVVKTSTRAIHGTGRLQRRGGGSGQAQ